jgi:acetyl-CoA carboxylase carboxyltransferase component
MDDDSIKDLEFRRRRALEMGGTASVEKIHDRGKLTARERLELLLDPDSFVEIGMLAHSQHGELKDRTPADGMLAGSGRIDGRAVYVTADDGTVLAGTRGRVAEVKNKRVRDLALKHEKPFIALMEAGAARVQETYGATAAGLGYRFGDHLKMSGRVPQVGAAVGPCFGGPSFTAAQSDFVPIVKGTGFLGMSGPPVVKVGIGLDTTSEEIGGGVMSAVETGQASYLAETEADCMASIRTFLSYLPSNCNEAPPRATPAQAPVDNAAGREAVARLVPNNHRRAYDMHKLIELLVDGGAFFELKRDHARSVITAFARMDGYPVGIIANQPLRQAGTIDEKGSAKVRQFIDLCDAFHIPLISLMDCPGFLVGPEIERQRMVSLTGRLLNSIFGASVPLATVVLRKAIGLAYIALGGRAVDPDLLVAWPGARFDVMGPEAGIELVHGREIAKAANPEATRDEIRRRIEVESSAYAAAGMGLIDDVIEPAETRVRILEVLDRCRRSQTYAWKHRIDP